MVINQQLCHVGELSAQNTPFGHICPQSLGQITIIIQVIWQLTVGRVTATRYQVTGYVVLRNH